MGYRKLINCLPGKPFVAACSALFFAVACFTVLRCGHPATIAEKQTSEHASTSSLQPVSFANAGTAVAYSGTASCAGCHGSIAATFAHTGKGRAFHKPDFDTLNRYPEKFPGTPVHDRYLNLTYRALLRAGQMYIAEFRTQGTDTLHYLEHKVDYVIGSGNQTRSYIYSSGGYLYEMPLTWYVKRRLWDLSPGYEAGHNSRFSRPVGEQCLSCHTGGLKLEAASVNRFTSVGNGIGCESCHGPGSLHVAAMQAGSHTDTSRKPDYTIVNPARLPVTLQTDICRQCHLEGITVPSEGKKPLDFRPGLKLSSFFHVLIPASANAASYGFASHAERLQLSRCYIASGGKLTCTGCHNPHAPLSESPAEFYDAKCAGCHTPGNKTCSAPQAERSMKQNGCITCHMPKSGVTDIPHVSTTDHFIRRRAAKPALENKPPKASELVFRNFSDSVASDRDIAEATLTYFETMDHDPALLKKLGAYAHSLPPADRVKYAYLSGSTGAALPYPTDPAQVTEAYTAFYYSSLLKSSGVPEMPWLQRAVSLAPANLEFRLRLAECWLNAGKTEPAAAAYKQVLALNPQEEKALANLGYCLMVQGSYTEALAYTQQAIKANPDNRRALENRVNIYIQLHNLPTALQLVTALSKKYPDDKNYRVLKTRLLQAR